MGPGCVKNIIRCMLIIYIVSRKSHGKQTYPLWCRATFVVASLCGASLESGSRKQLDRRHNQVTVREQSNMREYNKRSLSR